jgi:hypothetical protein
MISSSYMAQTRTVDSIRKLQQEVGELRQRVISLESERPGRKRKPLLAIKRRDVCAIDPERDSTTCPDASIYRYQSGCHGAACRLKQHEAYERRKVKRAAPVDLRSRKRTPAKAAPAPAKRGARKAPATKRTVKAPTKRVSKRPAA